MEHKRRIVWTWLLAVFFVGAGSNHFINPAPYFSMMPSYLPWPHTLVWISGVAEICGGVGILIPRLKLTAGWGLIALLVAVFPANLNVAINGWLGVNLPVWSLWARLPFQIIMIWAVHRVVIANSGITSHYGSHRENA